MGRAACNPIKTGRQRHSQPGTSSVRRFHQALMPLLTEWGGEDEGEVEGVSKVLMREYMEAWQKNV